MQKHIHKNLKELRSSSGSLHEKKKLHTLLQTLLLIGLFIVFMIAKLRLQKKLLASIY